MSNTRILYILFLVCQGICNPDSISAQCNCPDSVRTYFKHAAAQSVIQAGQYFQQSEVLDSIQISNDSINKVLDKICALYNSSGPARDSVFDKKTGFSFSYFYRNSNLHYLNFSGNKSSDVLNNWAAGKKSGDAILDKIIDKFHFKIEIKYYTNINSYAGTITTDSLINTNALLSKLGTINTSVIWNANITGDGSNWFHFQSKDTTYVVFSYKWGDCQAGCINRRTWAFGITKNCNVSKPLYASKIPMSPKQKTVILEDLNQDKSYCRNTTPYYQYSINYNTYGIQWTGGNYGNWWINNRKYSDTETLLTDSFGTFILRHIPNDPLGVWITDTVHVTRNPFNPRKNFIPKDSVSICPEKTIDFSTYLDSRLYDSVYLFKQFNLRTPTIYLDTNYKPIECFLEDSKSYCEISDTLYIRNYTVPTFTVPDTIDLYMGDSLRLDAGPNWINATWDFGDTTSGKGLKVSHWYNFHSDETWVFPSFIGTTVDSCVFQKTFLVRWYPTTNRTSNLNKSKACIVYPNPAINKIWIQNTQAKSYTIYNALGAAVQNGLWENQSVNIEKLTAGVYYIYSFDKLGNINHALFIIHR